MQTSLPVAERPRRPDWMKVRAPNRDSRYFDVKKLIHGASLHTICEEARCPNIGECWGRGTATFQILGDTCTRACRYCYVHSGKPDSPPDPLEPLRLAHVAAQMELKHVVVTSVDRDDVPDRGAGHYAATIRALKAKVPEASIEVLTPDFLGVEEDALRISLARVIDRLLLGGETAEIEVAAAAVERGADGIDVEHLRQARREGVAAGDAAQMIAREIVLRFHPRLHLGGFLLLQPAVGIGDADAVQRLGGVGAAGGGITG